MRQIWPTLLSQVFAETGCLPEVCKNNARLLKQTKQTKHLPSLQLLQHYSYLLTFPCWALNTTTIVLKYLKRIQIAPGHLPGEQLPQDDPKGVHVCCLAVVLVCHHLQHRLTACQPFSTYSPDDQQACSSTDKG